MELFIDLVKNCKGEYQDVWDNLWVIVDFEGMSVLLLEYYIGVIDVNGQVYLMLKYNSGLGVEMFICIVMLDDEGGNVELFFSVIFIVVISLDVDGVNMWGYMCGVVDVGNLYKCLLLVVEVSYKDGQFSENNEEWVIFNFVVLVIVQCGVGQVLDQLLLVYLYSEYVGGQMESEYGWLIEDYFIVVDSDVFGMVYVNFENGDSGKFIDMFNYLICLVNEMVVVLDVYFNDDLVIKNVDVKVDEQVKMNIYLCNVFNGIVIGNIDFIIIMVNGRWCDGLMIGFIDISNGEMQFDDVGYVVGQVYYGIIDVNGDVIIIFIQKKGVGLLMLLNIVFVDLLISMLVFCSVKFIVVISLDMLVVKMWGYMVDMIIVGDWIFEWFKLVGEVSNLLCIQDESNEIWVCVVYSDVVGNLDVGGCVVNCLLCIDQFEVLYNVNSGGKIYSIQGWLIYFNYWLFIYQSVIIWKLIVLMNGSEFVNSNVLIYVSCLVSDNLVVVFIIIELVNLLQWYDGSDVYVVKVKKGEMMQFKVMVKDVSGNLILEVLFVFICGDGYDCWGEKYIVQDGDDL